MNRAALYVVALAFIACMVGCKSIEPASDEHLLERVEGFCADWRDCRFEEAYESCSHNFCSAMDVTSFAYFMKKMPIQDYGAIEIAPALALREVIIEITWLNGSVSTIETWWKYECGNWFVDLIEWR